LASLVEELSTEHRMLREDFAQAEAGRLSVEGLLAFAQRLSSHIRKEERQLFECMQELMSSEAIAALGAILEDKLKDAAQVCAISAQSPAEDLARSGLINCQQLIDRGPLSARTFNCPFGDGNSTDGGQNIPPPTRSPN